MSDSMNNMPFLYPNPNILLNINNELLMLKKEIKDLNDRLRKLENQNKNNYLVKEEGKYMM